MIFLGYPFRENELPQDYTLELRWEMHFPDGLTQSLNSFETLFPLPVKTLSYAFLEGLSLFVSMQGQYVALACSRHGSRVLDAIWNGAALGARKEIAAELGEYHCVSDVSKLQNALLLAR